MEQDSTTIFVETVPPDETNNPLPQSSIVQLRIVIFSPFSIQIPAALFPYAPVVLSQFVYIYGGRAPRISMFSIVIYRGIVSLGTFAPPILITPRFAPQ